jgi:hypothetical protein
MGHIGEKGLWALHGKGTVECIYDCTLDVDFYEHYVYGKHDRVRFSFGATRQKRILKLLHSDVFGPVSVSSLDKFVYRVSFIDYFLRNTWIQEFKALVKNRIEKKIKALRKNNGGEIYGNKSKEFCKKWGISRQKNTPYTLLFPRLATFVRVLLGIITTWEMHHYHLSTLSR